MYEPAHEVSDDVGVADQYLGGVLLLAGRSPVEILPEGCLNPCTVTEKLLKGRRRKRFQIVEYI